MTVHPAIFLFAASGLAVWVPRLARAPLLFCGAVSALVAAVLLSQGAHWSYTVGDVQLELLRVDELSHLFGVIFTLITVIGVLYAWHTVQRGEHSAALVYAGGALGVVYSGDWISAFVWWELMALASLIVIWSGDTPRALAAGYRYVFVHATAGGLFFAGLLVHLTFGGGMALGPLNESGGWAYGLILTAVAINAAIPPFHAWLTDAYPEASVTGTVFLSAFTTKTAVYLLIRVFAGSELLVWAGVAMALYGVVYAVLENDIRRLLGYHIISQVGYMVTAVGIGTPLALGGAAAHAFCHILYKALLLMGAGAVITATGRRKLSELGGLAQRMPVVTVLYMVGAFSISGVPLFNGFVSKAMIVSAAGDNGLGLAELLLTLASIGTFLHTGLKLPYFTFFGAAQDLRPGPVPRNMTMAMSIAAAGCIVLGVAPGLLYARLAEAVEYHPYTFDHIAGSLQLLGGTALAFWWLLGQLRGEATESLDTDWFYRKPVPAVMNWAVGAAAATGQFGQAVSRRLIQAASGYAADPLSGIERLVTSSGGPPRRYDENHYRFPIGVTVFWVVFALWLLVLVAG